MITPAPGQGYWNFVVSVMVLVAVVYITVSGDLPKWFDLLSFQAAKPPVAGTAGSGVASQTAQNAAQNPTSPIAGAQAIGGQLWQQGQDIFNSNMATIRSLGGLFGIGK
jgi:hypothetical protein